jgi:D-alanyl-D-alanine carboxypeptidase
MTIARPDHRPDRRMVTLGTLGALALAACGDSKPKPETEPTAETPPPSTAAADAPPPVLTDVLTLKALLDAQLAASGVPALAAAAATREGLIVNAAAGRRRSTEPDPVTTDDHWHIGSCTKAMTAALYARLVEQNKAAWGATVPELFPNLAGQINPAFASTTVEQFMSHRSGLPDIGPPWLVARRMDTRPLPEQRMETARATLGLPPAGTPGEFAYANLNYIIVGAAIERITGMSWEDAITEHVFKPLGMTSAAFGPPAAPGPEGHVAGVAGAFTPRGKGPVADNPAALGPAGTVNLTLEDWAKFAAAFFDPKQTFLSAETIKHLTTPATGADYALGWGVVEHATAGRILTHAGSNTMWLAQIVVIPDRQAAVFATSNSASPQTDDAIRTISGALVTSVASGSLH